MLVILIAAGGKGVRIAVVKDEARDFICSYWMSGSWRNTLRGRSARQMRAAKRSRGDRGDAGQRIARAQRRRLRQQVLHITELPDALTKGVGVGQGMPPVKAAPPIQLQSEGM